MNQIHIQFHKSALGELVLGEYKERIVLCDWRYRKQRKAIDTRIMKGIGAEFTLQSTELITKTRTSIDAYLNGTMKSFDIPLLFVGSAFQKSVWNELLRIPYGKTISYLELSIRLGDEKAIRAVASANGANALAILVPCHRVIGIDGALTGYAGGVSVKRKLLEIENIDRFPHQRSLFDQNK